MTVRRYYAKHSQSSKYENRVTWMEKTSTHKVACYEYRGDPPVPACHGKAQNTNDEYIRIRPDILNTIKEKTEKPEKVYEDMDLIDGPRNSEKVKLGLL